MLSYTIVSSTCEKQVSLDDLPSVKSLNTAHSTEFGHKNLEA